MSFIAQFSVRLDQGSASRGLRGLKREVEDLEVAVRRVGADGRASDQFGRFLAGARTAGGGATRFSADLNQVAENFERIASVSKSAVATPIQVTKDLEATMSQVRAVTFKGIMGPEEVQLFKEMNAEARRLGAVTAFSASDAAGAMVMLGTGGFGAKQQIASLAGTLDLAAAGGVDMAQSASVSLVALKNWHLEADEMNRVGDVLVNTFTSSNTTLGSIADTLTYVGTAAYDSKTSIETTAAAIGELGNAGIKGSQAGTTLRAMLNRLAAPTDRRAKSALAYLGIDTKDKNKNLRPFEDILADMSKAMDRRFGVGKGGARRAGILKAVFGEEAMGGASALIASAGAGTLQASIASNQNSQGVASRVAADMTNNTLGATKELDSAMEELHLTIGEQVLPAFSETIKSLTEGARATASWAAENPGLSKGLMTTTAGLAAFATVGATVARGVAFLGTAFGFMKTGLIAVKGALLVASTAFRTFAVTLLTNPITWIVAAVVGLVAAGWWLYNNWSEVTTFFGKVWDAMPGPVQSALRLLYVPIGILMRIPTWLGEAWDAVGPTFSGVWDSVKGSTSEFLSWIGITPERITAVAQGITSAWDGTLEFFGGLWDGIAAGFDRMVGFITDKIGWLGDQIVDFERSLPGWMTGREAEVAGGAIERARAIQASAAAGAAALQGLAERFAGELQITLAAAPGTQVVSTEQRTSGGGLRLDTGLQGAF